VYSVRLCPNFVGEKKKRKVTGKRSVWQSRNVTLLELISNRCRGFHGGNAPYIGAVSLKDKVVVLKKGRKCALSWGPDPEDSARDAAERWTFLEDFSCAEARGCPSVPRRPPTGKWGETVDGKG